MFVVSSQHLRQVHFKVNMALGLQKEGTSLSTGRSRDEAYHESNFAGTIETTRRQGVAGSPPTETIVRWGRKKEKTNARL